MKSVAVILSGSGVYDGSEIHESVLTFLALEEQSIAYKCFAPNVKQYHVVNHLNGEEMNETRNVLIESARIARGDIQELSALNPDAFHGLVLPGGFGTAKNHTTWAFNGPAGDIHPEVKSAILNFSKKRKAILAMCMAPTTVAKALESSSIQAELTVGTTTENSPYEIAAISQGMESIGANAQMKSVREISVDEAHKIISAPCYMMQASLLEVRENILKAVKELKSRL